MFSLRTESNPSGAYALRLFCDSQSLHHHSVSGRTSLSFGERPLTSCPAKAPHLDVPVPRGTAYPQVSPSFRNHAVRGCPCRICFWHHSATSASDSRYTRVSPVQDRQRSVAFPRLLPCGATRLDPRLFPNVGRLFPLPGALHHWSAIARAGAWTWDFAPRRRFSRNAARLAGRGILQAASVPFTPPRKGASPFSPRSDGLDSILKERILRYR